MGAFVQIVYSTKQAVCLIFARSEGIVQVTVHKHIITHAFVCTDTRQHVAIGVMKPKGLSC